MIICRDGEQFVTAQLISLIHDRRSRDCDPSPSVPQSAFMWQLIEVFLTSCLRVFIHNKGANRSRTKYYCRPITLVVAKCWDPTPKGYFTVPHQEPVRPIDPSAWVAHTTALQQQTNLQRGGPLASSMDTVSTLTSSSLTSSMPDSQSEFRYYVSRARLNYWVKHSSAL